MDNKSILEAARNNGDRGHEYENKESVRASLVSAVVVLVVGMILFVVEFYMKDIVNISLVIVGVAAIASDMLYRGIAFKTLWRILIGGILSFVALVMIIARVVL